MMFFMSYHNSSLRGNLLPWQSTVFNCALNEIFTRRTCLSDSELSDSVNIEFSAPLVTNIQPSLLSFLSVHFLFFDWHLNKEKKVNKEKIKKDSLGYALTMTNNIVKSKISTSP